MADKDQFGFSDKAYGKALSDAAEKGGNKDKAFQELDQQALDQAYGIDTSKYKGDLRDVIQNKNIEVQKNKEKIKKDLAANPNKAGFQGILQNFTPGRMLASTLGSAFLGPVAGIIAGLLANKATTDSFKTDALDTINFFRPNFNVDTPDADLVREGDFNFIDRITNAIAAPNISTGVGELFKPRAMGLPEDFLDQSAVETQQLNPVMGMQYDDFVNPQDLQTIGMNQVDAINRLNTNINEQQTGDFNMPMINPELGATNIYPSGQAIESLPGGGVIFNDPALMAPNEVVVDPFSGQLVPNVNLDIPRMFDI